MFGINKILCAATLFMVFGGAYALEYNIGNTDFRLTGYGTFGMINPDIIASGSSLVIDNASIYTFGIVSSTSTSTIK